ncbi:GNAT family N-acetyltransferase [Halobacillus salinus]|uniref:GNAT family N-acetyltransferase n=1 Tax=Halobacillus salinus TaxID=192814 RepID=A0A4Z0H066_9BACI|nr:GNAT family N-acetyltransferase [Halobacillus salinus]TGB03833.1 GNAT family N-acetyltransferase [Halobacillus salinus]
MNFEQMKDFSAFTELSQRCYPGMKLNSKEEKERYTEHREKMNKEETIRTIGLYDQEKLVGGYIEYDFISNLYGSKVNSAGIGTVAVDLMNKKQGNAKRIIRKFLHDARQNRRPLAMLYPFQPSFYKRMGFGLGPRLHTYRFHPSQLPAFQDTLGTVELGEEDISAVSKCYNEWAHTTHGVSCDKEAYAFSFLKKDDRHTVGVFEDGELTGYVTFEFQQLEEGHFLQNDLIVSNFFYNSIKAYQSLLQFLHNQKDQVRSILFPTFDDRFSMILDNSCHIDETLIFSIYHKTSEAGQGLMYRIVDIPSFLESIQDHSFGDETIRIGWKIEDTLLDEHYEAVWQFEGGKPSLTDQPAEVTLELGIGEFSSLLLGCTSLKDILYRGAVKYDEADAFEKSLELFDNPLEPECWTFF